MKCSTPIHRSMAILLSILTCTNARTWRSIEIPAINDIIESDPLLGSASQLAMEDMTFLYGAASDEDSIKTSNNGPVTYSTPTRLPATSIEPSSYLFSGMPSSSSEPSKSIEKVSSNNIDESNVPTWSPSARYEATNGNCNAGEILHRIVMYVSSGDGSSSNTTLVIKETETSNAVFESKPKSNQTTDANSTTPDTSNTEYLCLKKSTCYTTMFYNNTQVGGMSWELHQVVLATGIGTISVASGTNDESECQFGLGGGTCMTSCAGEFKDGHLKGEAMTSSPSDLLLTTAPSPSPTWKRTRRPTTPAPSIYLPQDKEVSFGSQRYKKLQSVILAASPDSAAALADDDSPQHAALVWLYNSESKLPERRIVLRWILAAFYFGLDGANWFTNKGWLSSTNNECDWFGITCLNGLVTQISMEENRMVGEIVPELALLHDSLYYLSLGNNYDTPDVERNVVVMPVPSFLGDLSYLTYLNLEGLGLMSTIPRSIFSKWTRLESLYLNDNDITGTLPSTITSLKSIKTLWIGGNNLGGSIISEIGQLTTLTELSLESNFREDKAGKRGFMTALPASLAQLTNLEVLDVSDNALSGTIPPQLGDLISLRSLDLSNNFFESQLPTALGRLQMLEQIDISFNWLSSTIPKEYGDMISLTSLSLESNYKDQNGYFTWGIHGKLPSELGKLKNLKHLHLNDNYISGTLISEIGQLYFLETLHLQSNFLLGPIPAEYSNCVVLEEILLQDNNIDGALYGMPEGICQLPGLELARVDCRVSCPCCYGC